MTEGEGAEEEEERHQKEKTGSEISRGPGLNSQEMHRIFEILAQS